MPINPLFEEANRVETAWDLARFISSLSMSLDEQPELWPNRELRAYLKAMQRWMSTSATARHDRAEVPTWSEVASMLIASSTFFNGDDPH